MTTRLQWNRFNMTLSFSVIYNIKALKPDWLIKQLDLKVDCWLLVHLPWVYVLAVRVGAGGGRYIQFRWKSSSVLQRAWCSCPVLPRILASGSRRLWVIVRSGALVAVEGQRLSVQLQRYSNNSFLSQEGATSVCGLAAGFGAQRRVTLTPGRRRRV